MLCSLLTCATVVLSSYRPNYKQSVGLNYKLTGSHVDAGVSGQINRVELLVIAKSGAFVLKEVVSE